MTWYPEFRDAEDYGQLARRITRIVDCGALTDARAARERFLFLVMVSLPTVLISRLLLEVFFFLGV